jgi:WD40 repeat protein
MMPSRPVLAFDAHDRLVAHDGRGLRIWPAGSVSAQTAPAVEQPLPRVSAAGGEPFRIPLTAKTADGQNMVFVRSSAMFLWNAESGDEVIPVTPPSGWGADLNSAANKGVRVGAPGAEAILPQIRAVQVGPAADRIYLLDQTLGREIRLHAWAITGPSASAPAQALDLSWSLPLGDGVISIALRGDGAVLAVGDRTGGVALVDTSTKRIVGRIPALNKDADNLVLAMAFSPNGENLAIGSPEGTISLWAVGRPDKPRLRFHLPGHRGIVFSLAFDAQNRRLASAGNDPLVEVWDLELLERELVRLELAD